MSSSFRSMATSAGMQCTPLFYSNLAMSRPSQASLACAKPLRFERCELGLRQSLGYLRDRHVEGRRVVRFRGRGTGCVCMAAERKENAQPTIIAKGKKQVAEEEDGDRRVDPVGFLKERNLKTKAFQTFTRERFP